MHPLRSAILAAVAVAAFGSVASAASPPAVYNWTGVYIGANAGYAWGDADMTSRMTCPNGGCPYTDPVQLNFFGNQGSGSFSPNSFTGGGQIGFNFQNAALVWGAEVDWQSFDLSGNLARDGLVKAGTGQSFDLTGSFNTDWLLTARARLGWLVQPQTLLYVTGGLAVTEIKVANSISDNCSLIRVCGLPDLAGQSSSSSTKTGWALGGGVEWAYTPQWSLKAEYLYVSFDDASTTLLTNLAGAQNPNLFKTSVSLNASIARFGVNFKF
jgi:outer membrane immunogenic protein